MSGPSDRAQPARNPDDEGGRSHADLAREAALQSLVSNAVYLAVMLGFTLALAKRDAIARAWMRVQRIRAQRRAAEDRAVAEFRAELSDLEHNGGL